MCGIYLAHITCHDMIILKITVEEYLNYGAPHYAVFCIILSLHPS
jgi:hypothetical protein